MFFYFLFLICLITYLLQTYMCLNEFIFQPRKACAASESAETLSTCRHAIQFFNFLI